ncbi:site-specific integrase [Caulobacter vibrioides]|uniref:Site-specific integrase n=1 Tax=Caulobacter vibrioides TaxID=155892 RepID=A0A290MJX9_CAUVI|nr:site-specific integrase [Caulobacter vibrioides]ATC32102.1 site-specific integrase [Caulobacter vibrioides]
MATILKQKSGRWRAQVRRKGGYVSETFGLRKDAEAWARQIERDLDLGISPTARARDTIQTFGDLVDLHIRDMQSVGKPIRRTKAFSLDALKKQLGAVRIADLDREALITFGKARARAGAGPMTLGIDLGYIRTLLAHGASVHGLPYSPEPVALARQALRHLGLVGKGQERDRRPTQSEIERLIDYFRGLNGLTIPMGRIVKFAIATAMRQEEISRVTWEDLDARHKMLLIRDRKDPRQKQGNHQNIPLLDISGYDAWDLIEEQALHLGHRTGRIFPYNSRSVGAAFRRGCRHLRIADLRFHDLRHEATSRLFEAEFKIPEVSLVTGHKDWKMLQRYTHIRPEDLHAIGARRRALREAATT